MKLVHILVITAVILTAFAAEPNTDGVKEIPVEAKTKTSSEPVPGKLTYKDYPGQFERNITKEMQTFKKFVKHRHGQRLQAAKDIMNYDYAKQYKMLETIFEQLFEALQNTRVMLENGGFIPGDQWPMNMTLRDGMTVAIESTLFFGEMILRLPDVTHRLLRHHEDWETLIRWSWMVANESLSFLDEKMQAPIKLMAQELGIAEKDPDYINRYREENPLPGNSKLDKIMDELQKVDKKKLRKQFREKGPRMSSALNGDL